MCEALKDLFQNDIETVTGSYRLSQSKQCQSMSHCVQSVFSVNEKLGQQPTFTAIFKVELNSCCQRSLLHMGGGSGLMSLFADGLCWRFSIKTSVFQSFQAATRLQPENSAEMKKACASFVSLCSPGSVR